MINKLQSNPALTQEYLRRYYSNGDEIKVRLYNNFKSIISDPINLMSIPITINTDMHNILSRFDSDPMECKVNALTSKGYSYIKLGVWNFPIEVFVDANYHEEMSRNSLHKFK